MAKSETGTPGFDVENMPDEELEQLIEQAQAVLADRLHSQIEKLRSLARRAGFEVSVSRIGETGDGRRARRLVRRSASGGGSLGGGGKPVAAKYRNPDKPQETWSGRGREPKWLAEKIAAGRPRDNFLIEKST